jgi:hypothetical protein
LTDAAQLTFATDKGWTLFSYNVGDFNALHQQLMSEGRGHAGIILSAQGNPRSEQAVNDAVAES